jgi:hypothetical protein
MSHSSFEEASCSQQPQAQATAHRVVRAVLAASAERHSVGSMSALQDALTIRVTRESEPLRGSVIGVAMCDDDSSAVHPMCVCVCACVGRWLVHSPAGLVALE